MTKVKMLYDNNLFCGFDMAGHAGYNKGGPDVICASLSAASQLTINGLLDWIGCDYEEVVKLNDIVRGLLRFELPYPMYENVTTQQLFKTFELYVQMLSEQYPENVQIERRDET